MKNIHSDVEYTLEDKSFANHLNQPYFTFYIKPNSDNYPVISFQFNSKEGIRDFLYGIQSYQNEPNDANNKITDNLRKNGKWNNRKKEVGEDWLYSE